MRLHINKSTGLNRISVKNFCRFPVIEFTSLYEPVSQSHIKFINSSLC